MNGFYLQEEWSRCAEKRRYPRMPCSAPIEYAASGRTYRNLSRDISTGGLFVETWDTFAVGEKLTMNIPIEKQDPISVIGRIVRVERQGIGIEFI